MKISKLLHSGWLDKISYMFGIALILASVITNALPVKEVSACSAQMKVEGSSNCEYEGTRTVTWYVKNDWDKIARIESITVEHNGNPIDLGTYPISGFAVGSEIGPYNYDTGKWGSIGGTQVLPGSMTGSLKMTVTIKWTNNQTYTASKSITLSEVCPTPTPTK
ncbi:MAG: hypothetical protein Q8R87_06885, partial [Anaerolineaceae bacterium]|nr:hypothetical protein [Anaerolineaceae bacterium]